MNVDYTSLDCYGFGNLPRHLARCGWFGRLKEILLDFDWMVIKMYELVATQPLIEDYDLLKPERDSHAEALQKVLAQNSEILDTCESLAELANTLYSRLFGQVDLIESLTIRPTSLPTLCIVPQHPLPDLTHPAHILTLSMHSPTIPLEPVYDCVISPDNSHVVTALKDGTLTVWDLRTGNDKTLKGHTGPVLGCDISDDGPILVSASGDLVDRLEPLRRLQGNLELELIGVTASFSSHYESSTS